MRRRKSMALRAMVFLFLLMGTVIWNGCGSDVYEAVDTLQAGSVSEESTEDNGSSESVQVLAEEGTEKAASGSIVIYICGAVRAPGVYELPERARVYEAIQAAGGLTENADSVHTNQAKILSDGEQITILTVEEAKASPNTGTTENTAAGEENSLVNINTAGIAELTTLSGIGESRANDIISYREEHGPFQTTEDIMKVAGIKTALYSKIKDHICV